MELSNLKADPARMVLYWLSEGARLGWLGRASGEDKVRKPCAFGPRELGWVTPGHSVHCLRNLIEAFCHTGVCLTSPN